MYLSCASVCYRRYAADEVEAMLAHAPSVGFQFVDIHGPLTWSPAAIDRFDTATWRSRIKEAGVRCAGIYAPGFGGETAEQIESHARAIAKAAAHCAQLGGEHVVATGATSRHGNDVTSVIRSVRRIVELLPDDNRVRIGLEPHYGNVIEQAADYEAIFAAVDHPAIGVCVDTGHFHSAGVDTIALIQRFPDRICDVHLKDHRGTQSVAVGHGEIDLRGIIDALSSAGYAGSITLELEVRDVENAPQYVEEAYAALDDLLAGSA